MSGDTHCGTPRGTLNPVRAPGAFAPSTPRPIVVGLLGGVASGKSLIARQLEQLGAAVLDADRMGHAVLREAATRNAVRARWGDRILDAAGEVDRQKLAQIVFSNAPEAAAELAALEALTHPRIRQLLTREIEQQSAAGRRVLVLDAPVMLKAGWNHICNKIIFIDAPRALRLQRALARGWSEEEFAAREGAQESLEHKRKLADVVIDNSGPPEATQNEVATFWHSLGQ
jgi:dephospho-CoA kinase